MTGAKHPNSSLSMSPQPHQGQPIIREVACKSVLNRSAISDYSLNCYVGCEHACAYCYARYMQRFHPHEEAWGDFVDVKVNAVEVLEKQLRRAAPGDVFISSACDGWQPLERRWQLTRACCRLLLEHGFRVNALTKNALILRDLDLFVGRDAQISVTVTSLDEGLRRLWEPAGSTVEQRFDVLRQAHEAGIETGIMFGPLLPFLSDSLDSILALFARAADAHVNVIWVDALNPRPNVWEAVQALLQAQFPDLVERYRRVLFSPVVRAAYVKGLNERVRAAAARLHLSDRLAGCA